MDFARDDVLRCMRKALAQLCERKAPYSPRYYDLAELTIQALAEERPTLLQPNKTIQEVLTQTTNAPLGTLVVEAYFTFLTRGYIVPEPQGNTAPNLQGIRITDAGRQWVTGIEPVPEDQTGLLRALRANILALDPVIDQYIQEAVVAYGQQMFFASAVMIGAASEKAIYLLMYAIADALTDSAERKAMKSLLQERSMGKMLTRLSKKLEDAKKAGMPYEIHEGADKHLMSLQEAIRVQRNDAVHPEAGRVKPETVRLTLSAFPGACKKVYVLIDWFKNNKI